MFWILHHHFPADPFLSPNLGLLRGPQAPDGTIQLFYNYKLAEALNNPGWVCRPWWKGRHMLRMTQSADLQFSGVNPTSL